MRALERRREAGVDINGIKLDYDEEAPQGPQGWWLIPLTIVTILVWAAVPLCP